MRSEKGFTLIEVMVSILLTAIAIIGILALYMTETKASSFSRHNSEATMLATDKLEELRTALTPVSGTDSNLDPQGVSGGIFSRVWTVTNQSTYIDLVIRVGWDEDEAAGAACSTHASCPSQMCLPSGDCAGRAMVVYGRRAL